MLKRMLYKKIVVASTLVVVLFMLYLIPSNKEEIEVTQQLEYVYPNDIEAIYLLDNNNYISRTTISVDGEDIVSKSKDLIDKLTISGKKQDIIPNGFKTILPVGTRVLNIKLNDKILTIDFSREFYNVKESYEEKMLEALVFTLTSIDGVDKIEIYVEGEKLESLPNSKKKLPQYLDKSYGINKKYEITGVNNIDSYIVYYVFNYNDNTYYTPVTKYINNEKQDKVKIIIDELATSFVYESNLSSYLDANVKLLDYEIADKKIKLNFNDLILSDITNNVILEEVMYTIGLSLCDQYNLEQVVFQVDGKEKGTFSLKSLD